MNVLHRLNTDTKSKIDIFPPNNLRPDLNKLIVIIIDPIRLKTDYGEHILVPRRLSDPASNSDTQHEPNSVNASSNMSMI